ncbi:MAG: phosphatase PAP2 family protein [Armatimonadetes bacterium]|nr:phosphatase PAP2 family protein [Armatimonadota bacterium]
MRELDLAVFRAINQAPDWLEPVMVFFSEGNKLLWVRIGLLVLLAFFVWRKSTRKGAILAMVAWPVANAACDALKFGMRLPRPSVDLADAVLRVERLTSFGTASAHSATMMAVAIAFLFYSRPVGIAWIAVAALTGVSRVYVGVHYPYQVLLGWAVGAFIATVAVKSWMAFEHHRSASEPQGESQ